MGIGDVQILCGLQSQYHYIIHGFLSSQVKNGIHKACIIYMYTFLLKFNYRRCTEGRPLLMVAYVFAFLYVLYMQMSTTCSKSGYLSGYLSGLH